MRSWAGRVTEAEFASLDAWAHIARKITAVRCLRPAASVTALDIAGDGRLRARTRVPQKLMSFKQKCGI